LQALQRHENRAEPQIAYHIREYDLGNAVSQGGSKPEIRDDSDLRSLIGKAAPEIDVFDWPIEPVEGWY
jgi:hypothetical protein